MRHPTIYPIGRLFLLSLALLCAPLIAQAQSGAWPNRPVKILVPFPAGGSADLLARFIAQGLSEKFNQQFVVDNRSGAGGNIGTDAMAKAVPDGYTIGLSTSGPLVNNKFLYKNMPYDSDKDLTPIALIGEIPLVISSNPKVPARNLNEFLQLARSKPAEYSVGQPGNGTIGHLALEQLSIVSQTKLTIVPFRGDTPAVVDLLSGSIQALATPITALIPNISAGKLNGLAVTSAARYPGLPDIPTAKEQGIDLIATVWFGVVGPAGLPTDVVKSLNNEINTIIGSANGRAKLQTFGAVVNSGPPEMLRTLMREDSVKWQKVISSAKISIN
ncbi:MAG: Bug family tripartite tricarboxylate transporter substrate binding protein [Hylemonella sp.]